MAQSDKQILEGTILSQSDVARILKTSRQSINAGIGSKNPYFDTNRLMLIHRGLVQKQDQRADLVAKLLSDRGVQINEIGLNILNIVLSDDDATLISENKVLRDFLHEEVSNIISLGCAKFRATLDDHKKVRDENQRKLVDTFIQIRTMNM